VSGRQLPSRRMADDCWETAHQICPLLKRHAQQHQRRHLSLLSIALLCRPRAHSSKEFDMFEISPLGWIHTLGSLPAIPVAVYMFADRCNNGRSHRAFAAVRRNTWRRSA
jgi:hypothetical protein